jgi:hypothetical protein
LCRAEAAKQQEGTIDRLESSEAGGIYDADEKTTAPVEEYG